MCLDHIVLWTNLWFHTRNAIENDLDLINCWSQSTEELVAPWCWGNLLLYYYYYGRLFVCCLSPCSKTWKLPYFRPFQPDIQILSALAALYWPSTAFYWLSTTKYQPVPPYTDPVPPCINHYRSILTHYHQVSATTTTYWPSSTKYQPVPPFTDPIPPSTNH